MHAVATMRFTELKISGEGLEAPRGTGLRKAAAEVYNAPPLVRRSDKRPENASLRRESVAVEPRGGLTRPKRKFVVVATGRQKDYFKIITKSGGLTWKHKLTVEHLSLKVVAKTKTSAGFTSAC